MKASSRHNINNSRFNLSSSRYQLTLFKNDTIIIKKEVLKGEKGIERVKCEKFSFACESQGEIGDTLVR